MCSREYRISEHRRQWSSLWGHEPCEGCATVKWRRHAGAVVGAFGGTPHRAFGVAPSVRDLIGGG
eukprot:7749865-Pyramimonas_sp.AAC.1